MQERNRRFTGDLMDVVTSPIRLKGREKCDVNALFVFPWDPLCVLKGQSAGRFEKKTNVTETVTVQ